MQIKRSRHYRMNEEDFTLVFNHTDRRDDFTVTQNSAKIANVTSMPLLKSPKFYGTHHHDLANSLWYLLVNGMPNDAGLGAQSTLDIKTTRCVSGCAPVAEDGTIEERVRYWSVATDWDTGKVPVAGDDAEIGKGWNMFMDIQEG